MNKLNSLMLVAGALGGVAGTAQANAFLLNEFDAKAVGRGNASTATDTDASSIYYNVGGLAGGEGTQVTISGSIVVPFATFKDAATGAETSSTTDPALLPGFFISSRIHDMVAVGLGGYSPFGLSVDWPDNFIQADVVQHETLRTFFITPSIGLNLHSYVPGLLIGGGVDVVPGTVELTQGVFFGDRTDPGNVGSAHLGGDGVGIGGRAGAMYRPEALPQASIGVMWRSKVALDITGRGDFDAPAEFRSALPPDGPVTTTVNLPEQVTGGVAYRATSDFELEGNVYWTNWSQFQNLNINVPASIGSGTMTITQARDYTDTVSVRFGAEYGFPSHGAAVRAGFIFDPTPIPREHLTADLPDIDRYIVTVGGTMNFGNYDVHGALLGVLPGSRTTSDVLYMPQHKGTFDVAAFVATLTLSARYSVPHKPVVVVAE